MSSGEDAAVMHMRCECGHDVRAANERELIAAAQAHAVDVHGMTFTAPQILAAYARAGLDEIARSMETSAEDDGSPT